MVFVCCVCDLPLKIQKFCIDFKFLDAIASQEETYVSRSVITFKINIPNQQKPAKPTKVNQT